MSEEEHKPTSVIKGTTEMYKSSVTDGVRSSDDGKPRFGLVPWSVITKLAIHYANGSLHYGDRNWEKGLPISRYIDSIHRHLHYWEMGATDEPHLIAAIWNMMNVDWTLDAIARGELPPELDDRPQNVKDGKMWSQIEDYINNNISEMKPKWEEKRGKRD